MPRGCIIKGCHSDSSHYSFPKGLQGMLWRDAVWPHVTDRYKEKYTKEEFNRLDSKIGRICTDHFKDGLKSPFPGKDGYMPTIFPALQPDPQPAPEGASTKKVYSQRVEMLSMISSAFNETMTTTGRPTGESSRFIKGIPGPLRSTDKPPSEVRCSVDFTKGRPRSTNSQLYMLQQQIRAEGTRIDDPEGIIIDDPEGTRIVDPAGGGPDHGVDSSSESDGSDGSTDSSSDSDTSSSDEESVDIAMFELAKEKQRLEQEAAAIRKAKSTKRSMRRKAKRRRLVALRKKIVPAKKAAEEPEAKRSAFEEDDIYFKSYGDIAIHEEMIRDTVRTNTYRMAILRSVDRIAGKVVLDVGAGTGILSCICAQAGAKKVYAIEASEMAVQAKKVVEANGLSSRITVIHGKVEEVNVPERVDVIVSEWMGHFLLYESMLNSVVFARNKWLKLAGLILPGIATLYLAPITNEEIYKERIHFWDEPKKLYGVDMSCLKPHAKKCIFTNVQLEEMLGSDLIADSSQITKLNIHMATPQDLNKVMGKFNFKCFGGLPLCGFVSWFDVAFNIPGKEPLTISTAPGKHTTHWKQSVMYLDEPVPVGQDTEITGNIVLTPGKVHKRCLDVSLTFQVNNTGFIRKYYMGPEELNN